jgi:hypothetical protein
MIRKTDPNLFMNLMKKMLYLLCWKGVEEAEMLMKNANTARRNVSDTLNEDEENKPIKKMIVNYDDYVETIQRLADEIYRMK